MEKDKILKIIKYTTYILIIFSVGYMLGYVTGLYQYLKI